MHPPLFETTSTQQQGIEIRPRVIDWRFDEVPLNWAGSLGLTQFLNLLSVLAPHTEGWAIRLSRMVTADMQGCGMRTEIGGFCGQEARHSQAHSAFNTQVIDAQGYDCRKLNASMVLLTKQVERWPVQVQVATLCAAEHFLSMVGHWYLQHAPRAQIHPQGDRLFAWHSAEEIEHSAVAFDLYDGLYGTGWKARWIKRRALVRSSRMLSTLLYGLWKDLMSQAETLISDQHRVTAQPFNAESIRRLIGVLTGQAAHYFSFFWPSFHPWQQQKKFLGLLPKVFEEVSGNV